MARDRFEAFHDIDPSGSMPREVQKLVNRPKVNNRVPQRGDHREHTHSWPAWHGRPQPNTSHFGYLHYRTGRR
jgi:hypothetical protein